MKPTITGEKGSKGRWYKGYARIYKTRIEVQRWSYWVKKYGIKKAGCMLKEKKIVYVGGIYTDPEKSYNVKKLLREVLCKRKRKKM